MWMGSCRTPDPNHQGLRVSSGIAPQVLVLTKAEVTSSLSRLTRCPPQVLCVRRSHTGRASGLRGVHMSPPEVPAQGACAPRPETPVLACPWHLPLTTPPRGPLVPPQWSFHHGLSQWLSAGHLLTTRLPTCPLSCSSGSRHTRPRTGTRNAHAHLHAHWHAERARSRCPAATLGGRTPFAPRSSCCTATV